MKKVCGIYGIRHILSGRYYVGSAQYVQKRWAAHLHQLRSGNHHSIKLQRAWDKYGSAAFEWVVIEEVVALSILLAREQHWIDFHQASRDGFNIHPSAAGPRGHKFSAAIRAAMSVRRKGQLLGRPKSDEHRTKLALAATGRKHSLEARAQMSAYRKGRKLSGKALVNVVAELNRRNRSPEMRAISVKIGSASKGRKHSPMTRALMSAVSKGRPKSPEHIAALRTARQAKRIVPGQSSLDL